MQIFTMIFTQKCVAVPLHVVAEHTAGRNWRLLMSVDPHQKQLTVPVVKSGEYIFQL